MGRRTRGPVPALRQDRGHTVTSPSATGWTTDPRSSPLLDLLGPVLVRPEPNGSLSVALVVEQRHCNNRGSLHGGVLTALGDVALGRSAAMLTDPPTGLVTVENVTAGPPGTDKATLRGLAFRINAGDAVGVIGPSASGKSSLARLLVGLWVPISGTVRMDSVEVSSWDKAELGPYLGYLPQDVELFEGSVADNIARFGKVEPEMVVTAARRAGVHDMILRLANGYGTLLGPGGASISAGQRQRVALARALYGEPRLVVLDEPNASLDEAGEAALAAALQELKARGTTVVVITHRRSVLSAVDKVLCLRDGAVVAYGPCDAVLQALQKETAK